MVQSKGWEWEKVNVKQIQWQTPTEDGVYFARKWSDTGRKSVLDLGAGLGRHSIWFSKQGLQVSALDISGYAIAHLNEWAEREKLSIHTAVGDMMELPYADESFDCVFVYHAISHAYTRGVKRAIGEIKRVLRPGGELYTSVCSKASWDFLKSGFPQIDENTLLYTEDGPDKDVPHFYADVDDILTLLEDFNVEKIRHTDYCYLNGQKQDAKYYYVNGYKK
ncbi:MAG: SAM-dependent methyltransferase [Paenibacillaceae bacterium]|nr:SAM-dependent methyltransferase [Paenibacillaceae bacterium]